VPFTHEIGRAERVEILERFRAGTATALVSSQVLDEGIDLPDCDLAIIVGGTGSPRRQVQRIGRVLRPRPGKRAHVYELTVVETKDADYARRRSLGFDTTHMGTSP
jgi:superfamily II DNA or RNA helicase